MRVNFLVTGAPSRVRESGGEMDILPLLGDAVHLNAKQSAEAGIDWIPGLFLVTRRTFLRHALGPSAEHWVCTLTLTPEDA